MRGIYLMAGAGFLCACLAGWVALAWGQPTPGPAPGPESPPAAPAADKSGGPVPPGGMLPMPTPAPGAAAPEGGRGAAPAAPAAPVAPAPGPASPSPAAPVAGLVAGPESAPTAPSSPAAGSAATPAPLPGAAGGPAAFPPANERPGEVSATPDNPAARQEPAVSMEWIGTPTAKVGQPADYTLVVRNACNIAVQQVVVRVRVPAGLNVSWTEPKAASEGGLLIWELGTLLAKQERNLMLKMVADAKGDVTPQAWVTFTGSSAMRIKVREPKLTLKASALDKVLVGDPAQFTLTVSNPGDGSADQVKIHAVLSEGLEHVRGNKIDFDLGNLAAGESRNVTLLCATRTGGAQKCETTAEAEGGLHAKDSATVNVIMPRLDLVLSGPGLRYLERRALYTLKVTNPGDAPATNVTVADVVPAGFKVLAASHGGRHDFQTRTVSWFLGEVGPGQTREVQLEVQAINPGEHKHKATAVGARGLRAESEVMTRVEGVSALLVELVDTEDPIEVNGDTAYEVRITNTGSKTETDIKLVASVPEKMQFKNAQGPARYREEGKTIVFEPIQKLAPRADAIFRINVKALEPGTVRFQIQVTSTNLTEPVIKMEPTRIYSDAPEPATPATPATPAKPQ